MKEIQILKNNNIEFSGVIHVGAHRGEEITYYEEHFNAKQAIFIEPNPDVFDELKFNINNKLFFNIKSYCYCCAISDFDGESDFNIIYGEDAKFMEGNKGCSSLLDIDYKNVNEQNNKHHFIFQNKIKVPVSKLDTLLEINDHKFEDYQFLNIDAQGVELQVLKGAEKLLTKKSLKYILIESTIEKPFYKENCLFNDLKDFLEKRSFKFIQMIWHSEGIWGDALFIRGNDED
jgi:FkbM family methyltransferase